jgi:tripartite-type tricarboxylate transporter receptor subunit TctC
MKREAKIGIVRSLGTLGCFAVVLGASGMVAHADDFYQKRQMVLLIGNNVGSDYDLSGRLVGRHITRHIPGAPLLVPQNMPGASSLIATNYLFNIAPQDGSVLGSALQSIPLRQAFGDDNVKFDAAKLQWIGNPATSPNVMVMWHTSPIKTLEDAMRQAVPMGATTPDAASGVEVALTNNVLGTKFQLVTGYKGPQINFALEQGEVQGRSGQTWSGWKTSHPHWVKDGLIRPVLQIGLERAADLPDVPLMVDFAKTTDQRQILELFSAPVQIGRPLLVGPRVPAERVALLRTAFRETMADPTFLADAKQMNLDVSPVYGEALQTVVERMLATPPEVLAKAKEAMIYRK